MSGWSGTTILYPQAPRFIGGGIMCPEAPSAAVIFDTLFAYEQSASLTSALNLEQETSCR
jgi:hypothetical protein